MHILMKETGKGDDTYLQQYFQRKYKQISVHSFYSQTNNHIHDIAKYFNTLN